MSIKAVVLALFLLVPSTVLAAKGSGFVDKEDDDIADNYGPQDVLACMPNEPVSCPSPTPKFVLSAVINDDTVKPLKVWLHAQAAAHVRGVEIEINTRGGSVDAGFDLIKVMETSPFTITCVVDNKAYSEGFAILQACTKRVMTARSSAMTHAPHFETAEGGTVSYYLGLADSLRVISHSHAVMCSKRLNISFKEYLRRVDNKDWWMTPEDALKVGAIDEIR